jgi:hypothetical protein
MGRIHNFSRSYTITSVEYLVTQRLCVQDVCNVIEQHTERLSDLSVPPGETLNVAGYFFDIKHPPLRGEYRWDYQIKSAEGY